MPENSRTVRPERRTVNIPTDTHTKAQDAAWDDGKVTVGVWVAEAVEHYLTLTPKEREKFRAGMSRR